jgi:glucose/arabinose dehydrogenase
MMLLGLHPIRKAIPLRRILLMFVLLLLLTPHLPSLLHAQSPAYEVESVVRRARFPVALAFAPDGRLFYTEKEDGRVRVVNPDGMLQSEPVISLPSDPNVELGMLGIAIDPDFENNGYIWVIHIQPNTIEPPYPIYKVVRFREENGLGYDPQTMLAVPLVTRQQHHVGGNLHFDSNGYLFLSIGDMGDPAFSQDLEAMQGKIHRFQVVDDQLLPAPDNPFGDDSSVYAYGLRNPFDFDFDPMSGEVIAGENGPQCDDELNVIYPGGNYGWRPDYPCAGTLASEGRYSPPLVSYTPPEGITGVLVYDGAMFPEWEGDVFYCGWNGGIMRRMELSTDRSRSVGVEEVRMLNHSCSTDLAIGPDGAIYFTNFNSIYRLVAASGG